MLVRETTNLIERDQRSHVPPVSNLQTAVRSVQAPRL